MKKLPDYIRPGLEVLFVGINPGLRSAEVGHHFAGYANRFWKVLYEGGLVPFPLSYHDDWRLPQWGLGMTNIVSRATPGVHALTKEDYRRGKRRLEAKIRQYRPQIVALLGVSMSAVLFPDSGKPRPLQGAKPGKVRLGLLPHTLEGAKVFVLPNPSGRNAHYSYNEMVDCFRRLGSLRRMATDDTVHESDPSLLGQGRRTP